MVYRISAPTPEEKDEWIHSIKYVNEDLCGAPVRYFWQALGGFLFKGLI